jgi:hypothetical protein
MPRHNINYANISIYKIQHIDNDSLLYVGQTSDFTKRKSAHKTKAKRSKMNDCKLYLMIRENGGWEMFNMVEVKKFPCSNKKEADAEEDRVMRELKASMNSRSAFPVSGDYTFKSKTQEYKERMLVEYAELRERGKKLLEKVDQDIAYLNTTRY